MSRIKLVTLDLDNTLWDVDSIIVQAEAEMVAWLEAHVPDCVALYQSDALGEVRDEVFAQHKDRAHDLSFMRTAVLQTLMQRAGYGDTEARQLAGRAFEVFFEGRNRVVLFPGAEDMLTALAERYTLFALTNGNADIDKAGLAAYFQGAFSSADVGVKKPHARMFEAPLQRVDVAAHQAVHVGDHLVDDVQGAAGVGMHTVWVNLNDAMHEGDVHPTHEVSDLEQVAEVIRQLE